MADRAVLAQIKAQLEAVAETLKQERTVLTKFYIEQHKTELIRVDLARKIADREATVTYSVCSAVDENRKQVYPNETTRKVEIADRLRQEKEYQNLLKADDKARELLIGIRADQYVQDALIKRLEVTERILLADYERKE